MALYGFYYYYYGLLYSKGNAIVLVRVRTYSYFGGGVDTNVKTAEWHVQNMSYYDYVTMR